MKDVEQEKYVVNIRGFTCKDLIIRFKSLVVNSENVKEKLNEYIPKFRKLQKGQYKEILNIL